MDKSVKIPRPAYVLGWAGVLPFAGLCLMTLDNGSGAAVRFEPMLISYGAIILSFMGGVHWGLAMIKSTGEDAHVQPWHFALSVTPALIGWVATQLETSPALAVLAVAFLTLLIVDTAWASGNCAPAWYGRLRLQLTSAVLACLSAAWIYA
jgi:hypothetical protein